MNDYEQKCFQLDKELAKLIYGCPAFIDSCTDFMWFEADVHFSQPLARWTQDDAEAFRLAVEHNIQVCVYSDLVITEYMSNDYPTGDRYQYHSFPDKSSAVRFAIVQAVVNKLKGN